MNKELQIGSIYQHYKNKKQYKVIGIGKHTETLEDLVIYEPQYESETKYWIRPLAMFMDEVEYEGAKTPRFIFVR